MSAQNLSTLRVNDPVATQLVHGYCQADSIAPFVAPVITVPVRAGKIIKFTKEQFAVLNTRRAPGDNILRRSTTYTNENYYLEQHALAGEVTIEEYEEAINGDAKIDLRQQAILAAANGIAQSWELEVTGTITNPALYEAGNLETLAGTDQWSDAASDPEKKLQEWKEAIRSQIGCYPNSMVIDTATYNELRFHPIFRDRIKYTSGASVNLDMLAAWFDLPRGIMVAQKVQLDRATGELVDFMPKGTACLFYAPEGTKADDANGMPFKALDGSNKAMPSAFYTYQLASYPVVEQERFDKERKVFLNDVIAEQSVIPTGLGSTGLIGAGFLASDVIA